MLVMDTNDAPLLGLRTVIYPAPDLAAAKAVFTEVLGVAPYFDEPFYVGFEVGGYELGLSPDADPAAGPITYWGTAELEAAVARITPAAVSMPEPVHDVGEGIKVATVELPGGFRLGLIEHPHFTAAERPAAADGPGR